MIEQKLTLRMFMILGLIIAGCGDTPPVPIFPEVGPPEAGLEGGVDAGGDANVDAEPPPWRDECTAESMGSTVGIPCTDASECTDGCFCNGSEACISGTCVAGVDPCVDDVECTAEACLEETNQCFVEPLHELCSDDDACNGMESCDRIRGCRAAAPLYCNDENSCTVDTCDTETGCAYLPRDLDEDGFVSGACGGDDCDDDPRYGRMIYPGAMENCTNRRDDNCDGLRDYNDPTCTPTNDACASAQVLPGPGTYSGSTRGLTSDYTLACGGSGPDAVFRFTLTELQDVRVNISGGGTGVVLAIRRFDQCATGPEEKCYNGAPPSLLRRSLPAGDYAIIVKGPSGSPFDLTLMFEPPTVVPPVDVCGPGTLDITADASMAGGTTVMGMFPEVEDDYRLACAGSLSRRDAVYRITLTEPRQVVLRASTTGGSFASTYLALTTNCSSTVDQQCVASSTATITRRDLPAGVYYVMIESSSATPATWTLHAAITAPVIVPGDNCSMPTDISPPMGGTTGMGSADLSMMVGDGATSCGSTSSVARDAVFSFTLTETRNVRLNTYASGSSHWVSLNGACPRSAASPDLRCMSGSGTVAQLFYSLAAGTYYVVVSTTRSSGLLTANVTLEAPTMAPANDTCGGAETLVSGAPPVDGTLIGMTDTVIGWSSARPDVFYTFEITAAMGRSTVLLVINDGTAVGSVYSVLRAGCGSATNLSRVSGAAVATHSVTLSPGVYTVIVEKITSQVSPFTIFYTAFPAP